MHFATVLLKMSDDFYTKEERRALYAEYRELRDGQTVAFHSLHEVTPDDDLSWEQRRQTVRGDCRH